MNFEEKKKRLPPTTSPDLTDEIIEHVQDRMVCRSLCFPSLPHINIFKTHAMLISTQHLMPQADTQTKVSPPLTQAGDATPAKESTPAKNPRQIDGLFSLLRSKCILFEIG